MIKSLGYTVMVRRANYWGNGHHQTSEPGEYMYITGYIIGLHAYMSSPAPKPQHSAHQRILPCSGVGPMKTSTP